MAFPVKIARCFGVLESSYFGLEISDLSFGLSPFGRIPGFGLKLTKLKERSYVEFRNPHSKIRNGCAPPDCLKGERPLKPPP